MDLIAQHFGALAKFPGIDTEWRADLVQSIKGGCEFNYKTIWLYNPYPDEHSKFFAFLGTQENVFLLNTLTSGNKYPKMEQVRKNMFAYADQHQNNLKHVLIFNPPDNQCIYNIINELRRGEISEYPGSSKLHIEVPDVWIMSNRYPPASLNHVWARNTGRLII